MNGRKVLQALGGGTAYELPWCAHHHCSVAFTSSSRCSVGWLWKAAVEERVTRERAPTGAEPCRIVSALVIEPDALKPTTEEARK